MSTLSFTCQHTKEENVLKLSDAVYSYLPHDRRMHAIDELTVVHFVI